MKLKRPLSLLLALALTLGAASLVADFPGGSAGPTSGTAIYRTAINIGSISLLESNNSITAWFSATGFSGCTGPTCTINFASPDIAAAKVLASPATGPPGQLGPTTLAPEHLGANPLDGRWLKDAGGVSSYADIAGGTHVNLGGRNGFSCFDEMWNNAATSVVVYSCNLAPRLVGAGTSLAITGSGLGSHPGTVTCDTGTTATGNCGIMHTTVASAMAFGSGRWTYGGNFKLVALSDGTNRYNIIAGFNDTASAVGTDMIAFQYEDDVNGGKWQATTRSNGTSTSADTGITPDTNFHAYEIDVNAAGTSVAFSIDGAVVATNTTNIPTGSARASDLQPFNIISVLSVNPKPNLQMDAFWYSNDFTNPR